MTKIITVAAMKGGVGKTILTLNIAGVLAEDAKVLVIDADPQSNSTSGLGINVADFQGKTIGDIFEKGGKASLSEIIVKSPVPELSNLDLVPSSIWLTATEMSLVSRAARESILANFLKAKKNAEVIAKYDYVIVDTNPSMGIVNQNAFFVADSIVMVTDVSFNGAQGIEMFDALWGEVREALGKEDNLAALVINNADRRISLAAEIKDFLKSESYAEFLCDTVVPQRVKFKETEIGGKPINVMYPASEENKIMHALVDELKQKGAI